MCWVKISKKGFEMENLDIDWIGGNVKKSKKKLFKIFSFFFFYGWNNRD